MDLVVLAGARRRLPDKILNSDTGVLRDALEPRDAKQIMAFSAARCVPCADRLGRPMDGRREHLCLICAPTLPTVGATPRRNSYLQTWRNIDTE